MKPGGFLPFANQDLLGSDPVDCPLTERVEVGNLAMHAGMAARRRRYNPGVVTAASLMGPHALASALWLRRSNRVTRPGLAAAAVMGAAFGTLPLFMKLRMRRTA